MTTKEFIIEEAINDIVIFRTLPSQIDYTDPYRIKSDMAEKFLDTLPMELKSEALRKVEEKVDDYYTPLPGSEYSLANLDNMF